MIIILVSDPTEDCTIRVTLYRYIVTAVYLSLELKNKKLEIYQSVDDYSDVIDFISSISYCIVEELITTLTNHAANLTGYIKELDEITEKLTGNICAGVFGVVKVGKSTFLNALLGNVFLPSSKQAETAKRVKIIHDSTKKHADGTLFHSIGKNMNKLANGPKEIRSVLESINDDERAGNSTYEQLIIRAPFQFLKSEGIEAALELSDTPGINEAGNVFSNFTERTIKDMVAYIVMLPINALNTDGDLKVFNVLEKAYPNIFRNLNRVFIVVNDYDQTYKHVNNRTLKAENIPKFVTDYLKKPQILGKELSEDNVLPISALWALKARQWIANPYILCKEEIGLLVYDEAVNILGYAGIDGVKFLKACTVGNVRKLSQLLLKFSKIKDVEEKVSKMLTERSEHILYESVLDGTVAIANNIIFEVNTIIKNINKEEVEAETASCVSTMEKFTNILSMHKEHLTPTTFSTDVTDEIKVSIDTVTQALLNSMKGKVDSVIMELSGSNNEESKENLQKQIVSIKNSLVSEIKVMMKSELQKMKSFIHKAEGEKLKWILKETRSDLKEITSSSCEIIGSTMSQTLHIIDNMVESVTQIIHNVKFNTDIDFFAKVEIVSEESLKSMIKTDSINKFSHNDKKCAGILIFKSCFTVPVYKAVTVFSTKHSEMKIAYNSMVQQLLSKFSSQVKDSVESRSSLISEAAMNKFDSEFSSILRDMKRLVQDKQQSLELAKQQTELLIAKRRQLSLLSAQMREKINALD